MFDVSVRLIFYILTVITAADWGLETSDNKFQWGFLQKYYFQIFCFKSLQPASLKIENSGQTVFKIHFSLNPSLSCF